MWIRTQNKYILANANSFRICKDCIGDWVYYAINGHYDRYEQELGTYSTKEKALKVLDEIQDLIYKACDSGITYEMPQDEDIKV